MPFTISYALTIEVMNYSPHGGMTHGLKGVILIARAMAMAMAMNREILEHQLAQQPKGM